MNQRRSPHRHPFLIPICILLVFLPGAAPGGAPTEGRFFLMGDGNIQIRSSKTGQFASGALLLPDGSFNEETFNQIDRVFGFPTEEKGEHISPRLLFMLDYFSDLAAPGRVIHLESGYRSPEYNSSLRSAGANAAKTSVHMDGMALDFNIEGVNGKEMWGLIKSRDCCGVGHYGGANVHLDSSRPRFWEAATSKVRTGESDFNRHIYLSTEYDRYRPGETMRLSFSSVSDFGFGIKRAATLVSDSEGLRTVAPVQVETPRQEDCLMVRDRKASRFIYVLLPRELSPGKFRIRVDFCRRPYEQMPLKVVSNLIEFIAPSPTLRNEPVPGHR